MTFNDIWQKLCTKKPTLCNANSTAEFTSENLKKLLRQVYEQGEAEGKKSKPERSLFDKIF
jgi:hypothetical protein